ncbi:MAG: DUF4395 domain-containing protein [Desulfobacteraceae bacterium]|nr:DUF4395 domain-containing protein [Desulfobacteraceae bacterium]
MKALICPVSTQRINRKVVRITGFMMATMIALFAITGSIYFIIAITIDYFIRAFTSLKYSPFSWLAGQITRLFKLKEIQIDKAPKIFASRVGFLFALATVILYYFHPTSSLIVGLTLMGFALLESVFDFCVGCVVYTYVVIPIFKES